MSAATQSSWTCAAPSPAALKGRRILRSLQCGSLSVLDPVLLLSLSFHRDGHLLLCLWLSHSANNNLPWLALSVYTYNSPLLASSKQADGIWQGLDKSLTILQTSLPPAAQRTCLESPSAHCTHLTLSCATAATSARNKHNRDLRLRKVKLGESWGKAAKAARHPLSPQGTTSSGSRTSLYGLSPTPAAWRT